MKPGDKIIWIHKSRIDMTFISKEGIYLGVSRKRNCVRIKIQGRLGGAVERIVPPETIKIASGDNR